MPPPTCRSNGLPTAGARAILLVAALLAPRATSAREDASPRCELRDGDRVVLLGDTVMEREGEHGAIETALVGTHPGAGLTVRNLGWSGDTVWADSRGVFDAPSAGYARLLELVGGLEPTVVVVAYGRNESFAGPAGVADFRAQLATLCGDLRAVRGDSPPRLVLVTPPPFEAVPPLSIPAAATRNRALAEYAAAIRAVAAEEGAGVVDLFAAVADALPAGDRLTENGVHLSPAGSDAAAAVFAAAFGHPVSGDFASRTVALREAVVAKNRLFFHRWRPANETYLFLFRRHEQGNNAVEIPRFDPLVAEAEAKVRTLAQESR